MTSEAIADPPGLSMRMTMARIVLSARTLRTHSTNVSDPRTAPAGPSKLLDPLAMVPTAYSNAMRGPVPRPASNPRVYSLPSSRRVPCTGEASSIWSSYATASIRPAAKASPGRNGPRSMIRRTSSTDLLRPAAIALTS